MSRDSQFLQVEVQLPTTYHPSTNEASQQQNYERKPG